MISEKVFLLMLTEEKRKRAREGMWPKPGKEETVVNLKKKKKLKIQTTKIIDCSGSQTNP